MRCARNILGKDFREFVYPKDVSKVVSGVESQSTDTFRQRIRTPLGPQEVDITPFWADYYGKKARFTHMVPVPERVQ